MADYPPEWRRLLGLLAGSANGCTAALLFAHGFSDAVIAGLVDCGLATSTIERMAEWRTRTNLIEVMRLRIIEGAWRLRDSYAARAIRRHRRQRAG